MVRRPCVLAVIHSSRFRSSSATSRPQKTTPVPFTPWLPTGIRDAIRPRSRLTKPGGRPENVVRQYPPNGAPTAVPGCAVPDWREAVRDCNERTTHEELGANAARSVDHEV